MVTDAQKRAKAKYDKANMRQMSIKFYAPDADVVEWMDENGYKAAWVKDLIRAEYKRQKATE